MIRFILLSILLTILFRAVSRLMSGVLRGIQGEAPGQRTRGANTPQRGVHMERNPICGTFVVPANAVALSTSDGARVYFCSTECRDKFRAQPHTQHEPAHGRTA